MTHVASLRSTWAASLLIFFTAVACSGTSLAPGQQTGGNGGDPGGGGSVGGAAGGVTEAGGGHGHGLAGQGGGLRAGSACSNEPSGACPGDQICDYDQAQRCSDVGNKYGQCIIVPTACPDDHVPVCGCDGKTYENDCARQAARIELDHAGACREAGDGGVPKCGTTATCAIQDYCIIKLGTGECATAPTECAAAPTCDCLCGGSPSGCTGGCTCTETGGLVTLKCFGV